MLVVLQSKRLIEYRGEKVVCCMIRSVIFLSCHKLETIAKSETPVA